MRTSELKHIIVVESVTSVRGAKGEPTKTWGTFVTVRAKASSKQINESIEEQYIDATHSLNLVVRYNSLTTQITEKMRVLFEGQYYEIISPPTNIRFDKKWIKLLCRLKS